jgi:REP element-mobilizing transposase RayT
MNRGDRGGRIFKDKLDYELFFHAMGEVCDRTGWKLHASVFLPNHFHWLLETPESNLVAGMKWFLGAYSQRFNNRHGHRGHVFQGRYKAVVIQAESGRYFETVSTYVHLNPARARLLKDAEKGLEQYVWSSYPWYRESKRKRPPWLEVGRVLGNLGLKDDARGRAAYEDYMEGRVAELRTKAGKKEYKELWKPVRYGWYVGSEDFRERLLTKMSKVIEGKSRASYGGAGISRHDESEGERLIRAGMKILDVKEDDLGRLRKGHESKCLLAWLAHTRTMVSHAWLSRRLHMGYPTMVSKYIKRVNLTTSGPLLRLRKKLHRLY